MTLQKIRIATSDELKEAVKDLCKLLPKMTVGEKHAMARTIETRAEELEVPRQQLLAWQKEYSK